MRNFFNFKKEKKSLKTEPGQAEKKQAKKPQEIQRTTKAADAMPYHTVNIRIRKALMLDSYSESFKKAAFMLLLMANTAMRYSDAIKVTHEVIRLKFTKFRTQKNKQVLEVEFNDKVAIAYRILFKNKRPNGFIFLNARGDFISNQMVNRVAKNLFVDLVSKGYHVSSHSMRKTFAVRYMECQPNTFIALENLQRILGHSTINHTMRYLSSSFMYPKRQSRKSAFELKK